MKKILIYYNNDSFLYLIDELIKQFGIEEYSIVRTGERAIKERYNDVEIIKDINMIGKNQYDTAYVISESPFVNKMYYELHKIGVKKVYTINTEYLTTSKLENIISEFDMTEKPLIGYIETHLYNQCNLNCKGCTHFSNIDKTPFMSLEQYEQNIKKLSELYNINTFRLMGGEPLLNKDLSKYLEITNKYLTNSNVDIATNGLLICNMNKELIDTLKRLNITLKISLYLPIEKVRDKIDEFLNKYDIPHFYGNGCKQADDNLLIREFHKCLTLDKKYDALYNSNHCFAKECWFLKDHYLAKCATPLQIDVLNKKFNTHFEVTENDYIDISSLDYGSWDDVKKILGPNDFCRYCMPDEQKYDWEVRNKNQELEDYVVLRRRK